MKYFIGLDLSLTNTGIAIIDEYDGYDLSSVKTEAEINDSICLRFGRYKQIVDDIDSIIAMICRGQQSILGVAIEAQSFGSRGQLTKIAESGALVKDYFLKYISSPLIIEVYPIQLKKYLLGKMNEKGIAKNILCREVYKKYKVNIDDDNQVDAFILAKLCRDYYDTKIENKKIKLFNHQKEVIEKIYSSKIAKRKSKRRKKNEG